MISWCEIHHQRSQGTIMCTADNWFKQVCKIVAYQLEEDNDEA